MALVLADRVKETTSTTGTGSYSLGGASTGFKSFDDVLSSSDTTYYTATNGTDFEVGIGTFTAPSTLARTTILSSSNAGSEIDWTAGNKDIFITYPAGRSVYVSGSNIVPGNTATLPVVSGGTGASSDSAARTNLGATTLGSNIFTVTNPSAITFPRFNADNTISTLSDSDFRTAIGAGTGDGTVTSVGGTGTVNGISLSGTVTSSGSLTLGGSLSDVNLTTQVTGTLPVANGGTGITSLGAGVATFLGTPSSANLAAAVTDETGTGALVFASSPTLVTPALGTPSSVTLTNASGLPLSTGVTGTLAVSNGGTGQTSYTDGQLLIGNSTGNTLDKATLTAGSGISITNGSGSITVAATSAGTVTSVSGTGTVQGLTLSGTVTSSGSLTLGGSLSAVNLASQVSGTLPLANGGTGQTTAQTAINALAGATTSGQYLRGNGTNVVMSSIQAGDVPTLNQNTTGSAATLTTSRTIQTNLASTSAASFNGSANITPGITGTLPVANGGTGITSFGSGIATFLGTPTSANLAAAVTDETGSGSLVFGTGPTLTGFTLGGEAACADNLVTRPTLKDYAVEGSALGNTGASPTINLNNANFFSATVSAICTFTFSNPPASGDFGAFVLELTNGGAFAVTWPASVDWPGGTAPSLTVAGKDQLIFTTRDAGTTWFGFVAGYDIK